MKKHSGKPRDYRWATLEEHDPTSLSKRSRRRIKAPFASVKSGCQIDGCDNFPSNVAAGMLFEAKTIRMCEEHYILTLHTMARIYERDSLIRHITETREADRVRFNREQDESKAREKERRSQQAGWIYYIKVDDLIKIGYATILIERLRQYPPNIKVLAVHPGTRELETFLHRKFRLHLKQGREWYTDNPVIHAHINAVVSTYGKAEEEHPYLAEYGLVEADPTRITS